MVFADVNPDLIMACIESLGLRPDGRLIALNSYENRVYQVGMEEGAPLIAKFYRPHRWSDEAIHEEHQFLLELADAEIPAVPPIVIDSQTLFCFSGYRFSLFPRKGGRPPELDHPGVLEWMGRFVGRIHAVGTQKAFMARPALDIASFGEQPIEYLLTHKFIPPELIEPYQAVAKMAMDGVRKCFDRAGDVAHLRLHGDCHMGNVLWTDDGPHFVDFDDSRTGPAVQDLWMMLSGTADEMRAQFNALLDGYEDFVEFNPRETHLIEALRTLRLIHYSAWLAQRWDDPAFPRNFPWFNTQQYWQERILELREQVALMQEPPFLLQGNF